MSVSTKMTSIADKIRGLLNLTEPMGLDEMNNNLQTVTTEVVTQEDLIAQIINALDGKAADNTIYIGSATPSSDVGINGDIYIVRGE